MLILPLLQRKEAQKMFVILATTFLVLAVFCWFILPLLRDYLAVLKDMLETLKQTKERPRKVAETRTVLRDLIDKAEKAKVPLANIRDRINAVLAKAQLNHESCAAVKEFLNSINEKITLLEQTANDFMKDANMEIAHEVEGTELTVPDISLQLSDIRCVKVIDETLMTHPDEEAPSVERKYAILKAYP